MDIKQIGIIGAGAWGTALAQTGAKAGRKIVLWGRDHRHITDMITTGENRKYLPGYNLNRKIVLTPRLDDLAGCDALLYVSPAQSLVPMLKSFSRIITDNQPLIICAKGIDHDNGLFLSQCLSNAYPRARVGVLSGPSFASDVIAGRPVAVTIAADQLQLAMALSKALSCDSFRAYASDDVRGVEIGGALKNAMAIAGGIVDGYGLGRSANAGLISRAFKELVEFGLGFGAKFDTLTGLSGLGDLVLSATSPESRNFSFGFKLGQGLKLNEAIGGKLIEGVATTAIVCAMAEEKAIEMPIATAVRDVITEITGINQAVLNLMRRPLKAEFAT